MKSFTHQEYTIVQQLYEEYTYFQSILTQDSPEDDWERYHQIECMYQDALYRLVHD